MVATEIRHRYAEEIRINTKVSSALLLKAFQNVPREDFVGSGPWKVLSPVPGQTRPQIAEVTDPGGVIPRRGSITRPVAISHKWQSRHSGTMACTC